MYAWLFILVVGAVETLVSWLWPEFFLPTFAVLGGLAVGVVIYLITNYADDQENAQKVALVFLIGGATIFFACGGGVGWTITFAATSLVGWLVMECHELSLIDLTEEWSYD